jgi:hypothetical protein
MMLKQGEVTAADEQAQAEAIYRDIIGVVNAHQPLIAGAVVTALATAIAEATSSLSEPMKIAAIAYAGRVVAEYHIQDVVQSNQIN